MDTLDTSKLWGLEIYDKEKHNLSVKLKSFCSFKTDEQIRIER